MNPSILRPITPFVAFPECVRMYPRVPPGGPPATTYYQLYRAERQEQDKSNDDPALGQAEMTWTVWQTDLDQAGAPTPLVDYVIQDEAGVRWIAIKVELREQFQEFLMTCIRER